jgi:hypothetical protein
VYYGLLLRDSDLSQDASVIFQKTALKPDVFPKSYLKNFTSKAVNCVITLPPMDSNDLDLVVNKYTNLCKELTRLLSHPSKDTIFSQILSHTDLSKLLSYEIYYLNNNEAKEDVNEIGNYYTLLLNKVITVISKEEKARGIYKKMMVECWKELAGRTSQTFNRSFERLFARLTFEFFEHSLPTKEQLAGLLGNIDGATIRKLINSFVDFKILFHEEYQSLITGKDAKDKSERHVIANLQLVALDEFYLKTIANLLEPEAIRVLYSEYVDQKLG